MNEPYEIINLEKPEWSIIGGGVHDYNTEQVGQSNEQNLCFVLQGADQDIIGGVIGSTYWGWFYISLMWVKAEFRGRGYGQRLLNQAEAEARERGAKYALSYIYKNSPLERDVIVIPDYQRVMTAQDKETIQETVALAAKSCYLEKVELN